MEWRYPTYYDIDNFKMVQPASVVRPTAEERLQMKLYLNSLYGKMASCIHFTDGKENDKMIKGLDYILIHVDKEPVIIFKPHIIAIEKAEGKAFISLEKSNYISDETYAEVVKQAL